MNRIQKIYRILHKAYGPQGWWPLLGCDGVNPTKTGSVKGYHPGDYSYPHDDAECFEICLGAILTQNTAWPNVEKALRALKRIGALSVGGISRLSDGKLRELIRPAGYYNQKAKKIRAFLELYRRLDGRVPSRDELLGVWGIGPETADSMLLYAFRVPTFVVDAYTRRIFRKLGMVEGNADYDDIRKMFEDGLPKDVPLYQEYHALIVEHAKRYYQKRGDFEKDFMFREIVRERVLV